MKLYAKDKKEKLAEIFKLTKKKNVLYMMNNSKIITYIVEKIKKEKKIFFKTKKKYSNINFLDLLADNKALKNKIFSKYNLVILCTGSNFFLRGGIANYPGLKFSYEETAVTTTILASKRLRTPKSKALEAPPAKERLTILKPSSF